MAEVAPPAFPSALCIAFSEAADGDLGLDGDAEAASRFARKIGLGEEDEIFVARQVHGAEVLEAPGANEAAFGGLRVVGPADGVVVGPGAFAGVFTADCAPVLLADPATRRAAAVHVGWRGLAAGVIAEAVGRFEAPARLFAFVGPAARAPCYEVGRDVYEAAARAAGIAPPPAGVERLPLDLAGAAAATLRRLGVRNVRLDGRCTICDPTLHSHRRAIAAGGATAGRMLGVIGWRS